METENKQPQPTDEKAIAFDRHVSGSKKMREFTANYRFRGSIYKHKILAKNPNHARQLAKEYERDSNKGECRSDRLFLKSISGS